MTQMLPTLSDGEVSRAIPADEEAGFGALATARGHLPLKAMQVHSRLEGLLAETTVCQTFVNVLDEPLEATYIFPLPDRAAVTRFRMEVAGRVIEGVLKERAAARREYDEALRAGHRAAITEEERPDIFTLRVGNLMPGEEAAVRLTLVGPLPYSDGEVTFRFPLVVAPRYIPGRPLPGPSVGDGVVPDTDAVPDASRLTPPVLLPGFPNPVRLALTVEVHPAGLPLTDFRSSLHAVVQEERDGVRRIRLQPGERLDRDFLLRFRVGVEAVATTLTLRPDAEQDGREGTFLLTLVPPAGPAASPRPRDVIFLLDRSGSMGGWKVVAARRAMARMIDTLSDRDRFTVYAFDNVIETPPEFRGLGLLPAGNRNRYRAVEFLARMEARGGTEMAQPLDRAVTELAASDRERDRILVLVTDGQVGNEAQILGNLGGRLRDLRVFTLGIDRAVNEAFLRRLAELGGGVCEVVESEERLDEVMDQIHRRLGTPVLTGLRIEPAGLQFEPDAVVPGRLPALFAGAPLCILGRYRGSAPGSIALQATDAAGRPWYTTPPAAVSTNPAITHVWARGYVRELEDRYVMGQRELEPRIVATSLKFGVLCRFTAFVAVDRSEVVNAGGQVHRILQPVEAPSGWEMPGLPGACAPLAVPPPAMALYSAECLPSMSSQGAELRDLDLSHRAMPRMARHRGLLSRAADALKQKLKGATAAPDLTPYRQRARQLLERLKGVAAADEAARVQALDALAPELAKLIAALKAVSAPAAELQPLEQLVRKLATRRRAKPEAIAQLWAECEQVLEAFAGPGGPAAADAERREGFWK